MFSEGMFNQYFDGFVSKPHNSFLSDFIARIVRLMNLHNVPNHVQIEESVICLQYSLSTFFLGKEDFYCK